MRPTFLVLLAAALATSACTSAPTTTTTTRGGTVPTTTAPGPTTTVEGPTSTTAATTTTTTSPPTTTTAAGPEIVELRAVVSGGAVTTELRQSVPSGSMVRLTVEADVADEVHIHVYDLKADVAPDEPAVLEFVTDIPGIFEVELEGTHLLVMSLEVTP